MENFGFNMNQLKKYGWYYDCDPEELIFLTKSEHFLLHQSGKRHYKITHLSEETKKKLSEMFKGKNNPFYGKCNKDLCKKVLCVDTGETYQSISEAANKLNLCRVGISSVCNGRRITCGGYHFRFIETEVKNEQAI